MTLVICHGGQTGVERGAHAGALDTGLLIAGYMPRNQHDEAGWIPKEISDRLWRCIVGERDGGLPARMGANIELCHAVLFIVQDSERVEIDPDTELAFELAGKSKRPWMAATPDTLVKEIQRWMTGLREDHGPGELRLLVTGPRASRWPNGEQVARSFVATLGGAQCAWQINAGGGW